ncbi:thioesterase II family protein [Pseudochelatococcus sp. B33]
MNNNSIPPLTTSKHLSSDDVGFRIGHQLAKRWLPHIEDRVPAGVHRLFCLPFAGGGASAFHLLRREAPDWLDVQPVQLPGRENRFPEAPLDKLDDILSGLRGALAPFIHEPYSLLGYSFGAHVARALADDFLHRRLPLPQKLIVAAHRAPGEPSRRVAVHKLPSDLFWRQLAQYEGTPATVLHNRELRAILEPMLRADFAVSASPLPSSGPIPSPIVALAGSDDPFAGPHEMAGWARETRGSFRLVVVEGSHFFMRSNASGFTNHVFGQLADVAPRHGGRTTLPDAPGPIFQGSPAINA